MDTQSLGQFIIVAIFTFVLTLVMMNLLIALMGNAYERVQANNRAADAKALAYMLLEIEVFYTAFRCKRRIH